MKASLNNGSRVFPERCNEAGAAAAVSGRARAPTAGATGAPQNTCPEDSGLMRSGSPRDRNVRTQERFEPGVHVHAHVDQRSNSDWFEPWIAWGPTFRKVRAGPLSMPPTDG